MEERKTGNEECFGEMPQDVPQGMTWERLKKWLGECPQGFKQFLFL